MDVATNRLMVLYTEMMRARAIESIALQLVESREFAGFYHPGVGQEAGPIAVCSQLLMQDYLYYAHRGLGYLTARGMDPVEIIGDLLAVEAGSTRGLGAGTVHCVDPARGVLGQGGTLGSCFPLAVGSALASRLLGHGAVVAAFFGDGASARGTFLESAVMALSESLPVLFVCENNGYAVSATTRDTQGVDSLIPRASGLGLESVAVGVEDVREVDEAAKRLIDHARSGRGPAFLEIRSVRRPGHFAGDQQPYRRRDEGLASSEDPVDRAFEDLRRAGVALDVLEQVALTAAQEMEGALAQARRSSKPNEKRLFEGVWA